MTNKKGLPDFPKIKEEVSFEQVLKHYSLLDKLKRNDDQLSGVCPIHQGDGKKSFSVNLAKNCFNCFSCKAHGNILDFVAAMENVDLKEAGLLLSDWFNIPLRAGRTESRTAPVYADRQAGKISQGDEIAGKPVQEKRPLVRKGKEQEKAETSSRAAEVINPPLTFELKNLDCEHPYLKGRGLLPETIKFFGLGYCSKGLMSGRVVIPIHNEKGELVAYAGRAVDAQGEGEGKYKLPPKFQKSHVVFNLHRVKTLVRENELILVEGYFSVFRLTQAGFPCVVALMGSSISCEQEELILEAVGKSGRVVLLFDNDSAGWTCTEDALKRLSRRCFIKVASLPPSVRQVDELRDEEIKALLA